MAFSANLPPSEGAVHKSCQEKIRWEPGIASFYSPITHFTGLHFYSVVEGTNSLNEFNSAGVSVRML